VEVAAGVVVSAAVATAAPVPMLAIAATNNPIFLFNFMTAILNQGE
jgi:hypothetical protein